MRAEGGSYAVLAGIVPGIAVGAAAAVMLAYPLTDERIRQLVRVTDARRMARRPDGAVGST